MLLCIWMENIYNGRKWGRWVRNTHGRLCIGLDREHHQILCSQVWSRGKRVFFHIMIIWQFWLKMKMGMHLAVSSQLSCSCMYECIFKLVSISVMVTVWAFELLEVIVDLMLCRVTLTLFLNLVSFRVFFLPFCLRYSYCVGIFPFSPYASFLFDSQYLLTLYVSSNWF